MADYIGIALIITAAILFYIFKFGFIFGFIIGLITMIYLARNNSFVRMWLDMKHDTLRGLIDKWQKKMKDMDMIPALDDAIIDDDQYKMREFEVLKMRLDEITSRYGENTEDVKRKDPAQPPSTIGQAKHGIIRMFSKSRQILVMMELNTGDLDCFIAKVNGLGFTWHAKQYLIDDSLKKYNIASGLWQLDYHEDFVLPIGRKIPLDKIRRGIMIPGVTEVDLAINPTTLKYFIDSEIAQKIIKGADMEKVFDFMKNMLIFIAIMTVITMIVIIKASGVLSNIHIPGFGR